MDKASAHGATSGQRSGHHQRADPPTLDIRRDQNPADHELIRRMGPKPVGADHPGTVQADLVAIGRGREKLDVARTFAWVKERWAIGVEQGQASQLVTDPVRAE